MTGAALFGAFIGGFIFGAMSARSPLNLNHEFDDRKDGKE